MSEPVIRPAVAADLARIRAIAARTEMFIGEELDAFMAEAEAASTAGDVAAKRLDVAALAQDAGSVVVVGAGYFGLEPMAQGVLNLYFIAVDPSYRRRGVAEAVLAHVEDWGRRAGARLEREPIRWHHLVGKFARQNEELLRFSDHE